MAQINEHILPPPLGVFERDLLEPPVCDIRKQNAPLSSVGATPVPPLPAGSTGDSMRYFVSWTLKTGSFCFSSQAALLHWVALAWLHAHPPAISVVLSRGDAGMPLPSQQSRLIGLFLLPEVLYFYSHRQILQQVLSISRSTFKLLFKLLA